MHPKWETTDDQSGYEELVVPVSIFIRPKGVGHLDLRRGSMKNYESASNWVESPPNS